MQDKITIQQILEKKKDGKKIVMLTAYDYPLAQLIDEMDVDIILVGDSLANVVLGLESTRDVGMAEMIHHCKAVGRAVKKALLVGDMPFGSYQIEPAMAVSNAKRFIDEAGCDAIKLEWFDQCPEIAKAIVDAGIPVMGHVGLTPQTAEQLGGFIVQGRDVVSARKLIHQAKDLQTAGCFSVVLECIPDKLSEIITHTLSIPTIGIGAGKACDGQVLVTHDIIGLFEKFRPKFVKQFVNVKSLIQEGVFRFQEEVSLGQFPDDDHSFHISQDELDKL